MELEIRKNLYDIQTSINSIEEYLEGKRDFNLYLSNKLLRRGIERELEIIGEAMNRILKIDSGFELVDARKIVNLRNWVIHNYDKIDDVIIWGIISKNIPALKKQIDKLLC
ncbi:MAG: DUF86 domain-containing protein [Bacteroidetes bacterium]|nr:MAG: DUF86 domain-containing protein [Bacteroidota bacterium]